MEVRLPVVAGCFYEGEKKYLVEQIKGCFLHELGPGKIPKTIKKETKIVGLIVPHAGFMYSGPVAAYAYHDLASEGNTQTFIIIGPNHTGLGAPVSSVKKGKWITPLGDALLDSKLAEKIIDGKTVFEDFSAHSTEHSIEVQLPFLQFLYKKVKFVPICMLDQTFETCKRLAEILAKSINGINAVIIASSDFSHYVPYEFAYKNDLNAIEYIKRLDAKKFYETVVSKGLSVCGYGPITTMLIVCKKLGAKSGPLLKYATSGDITNEKSSVVGYCAVKVIK